MPPSLGQLPGSPDTRRGWSGIAKSETGVCIVFMFNMEYQIYKKVPAVLYCFVICCTGVMCTEFSEYH